MWICIVPRHQHTSMALRYDMHQVSHQDSSRDLTVLPAHPAFIR